MGLAGSKMTEIAVHYKVSRQRIKQVISKYIPDWNINYGRVVRIQQQLKRWENKWGQKTNTELYREQRHKFNRKKANATKVGYTWTVDFGEINWPTHCPILGLELDYFAENRQENSPSFDRLDNTKGYEPQNVIILSWRANRIKNDGTALEHRKIAEFLEKT